MRHAYSALFGITGNSHLTAERMARSTKSRTAVTSGPTPWWLDEGEEDCPHCDQTYTYSAEVRCFDCDASICPMCIVRVGEHVFCPDCGEQAS
jgi:hypothetical protein